MADIAAPVHLLVAEDSHPEFDHAAGRLAARLDIEVTSVPGAHFGYVDHPQGLAKAVSALLRNNPLTTLTSPFPGHAQNPQNVAMPRATAHPGQAAPRPRS